MNENSKKTFPNGWDEHHREQILFRLKNSTALDRLKWLEQMLVLLSLKEEYPIESERPLLKPK